MFIQGNGRCLSLDKVRVMGILNMTPDSFSDGGRFNGLDKALFHAESMIAAGVDIIDIGGESTRPGAAEVSELEELERVLPVIEKIVSRFDIFVSVDTSRPKVMTAAANAGVNLINDVRALEVPGALQASAATGLPVCLMHMRGSPVSMQNEPEYRDPVSDIIEYLQERVNACLQAGIDATRLLVDPGFGFGKTLDHNLALLARLKEFKSLQLPVLVGMSRKTMIGDILNRPVSERMVGSVAAAVIAAMNGADIVRVHDVKESVEAIKVFNAQRPWQKQAGEVN
ncbi:dihydropteroate synthase [Gynuella sunshinyii]|uniref:Dihydropteroate synthase n=1 Tax=Gynuella sunshinyii YC6258 TaxID=1445510 RepID=A0A0C5VRN8_9GAMM|nr:dihydropteroate synthase [Gynuella sunshinyii]AJQ97282.1 dihydropteroate synthase-related enzyme [Gynuella sunshinyii YC6258]